MKAYFQTKLGTLYHGDCLEVMKEIPDGSVDLVLTDPPYLNLYGGGKRYQGGVAPTSKNSEAVGDIWDANINWVKTAWNKALFGMMFFCSYHSVAEFRNALSETKPLSLLVWYKRNAGWLLANAPKYDCEFVWVFSKGSKMKWKRLKTSLLDFPFLTAGCITTGERVINKNGGVAHPAQKPSSLMVHLLGVGGDSVLDPFLGSGTTAIACERLNRRWIGIEIEEMYCEIAAKRIERENQQLKMFT